MKTIRKVVFYFFLLTSISFLLFNCKKTPIPRPYGYFRVDLPKHKYSGFDSLSLPYSFDKSVYAGVRPRLAKGENYWIDIFYPSLNAVIYCSYKPVHSNLINLLEDTRKIAYKHSVRADAITETLYLNKDKHVYGILYDLSGNTASQVQFVLTDSVRHFFRGALYFENVPNKDSIAPMSNYVREDIIHLMESFEWKN